MKKISSSTTWAHKKLFPVFWFSFLSIHFAMMLYAVFFSKTATPWPVLLITPIMMIFGYFLMKFLIFDLIDEVYDCVDHLLIRNNGKEEFIFLKDIINVSDSLLINPKRLTLMVNRDTLFGRKLSFIPKSVKFFRPNFLPSPIADELIHRSIEARLK